MATKLTRKQVHDTNAKINLSILNTMMGQIGGLYMVDAGERVGEIGNHAVPIWWDAERAPAPVEFDMGTAEQSFFVGAVIKRSDYDRQPHGAIVLTDGSLFLPFEHPYADEDDAVGEMREWMEVIASVSSPREPQAPAVRTRERAAAQEPAAI
jgi:hypothetical protein